MREKGGSAVVVELGLKLDALPAARIGGIRVFGFVGWEVAVGRRKAGRSIFTESDCMIVLL